MYIELKDDKVTIPKDKYDVEIDYSTVESKLSE